VTRYIHDPRPFTPESIRDQGDGLRPSAARLLELIDTSDPAWPATAAALREMTLAGVELDAATVTAAVKIGRRRWETTEKEALAWAAKHERIGLAVSSASIVYYVRRGSLIKIGTTVDPAKRFSTLLPDEILAFEPGSYPEEAARHRQFRHLRCRGEHFTMAAELLDRIREIRALYGDPDPAWLTTSHRERGGGLPQPGTERITASDAYRKLGIKTGTLGAWVSRRRIAPAGQDERGEQLFAVSQLVHLRDHPRARRRGDELPDQAGAV
jgi:hypothetical protein